MHSTFKRSHDEVEALLTAPGALHELEHALVDGRMQRVYKNTPPNQRDLWLGSAKMFGPATYLVYENERLSFNDTHALICRAANVFRNTYGIRKGDRIGIVMRNLPEWIICYWAAQLLGAVSVAVNAMLPAKVLAHCIANTQCKLVVVDPERADRLERSIFSIRQEAGSSGVLVVRSQEGKGSWRGMKNWKDAMSSDGSDPMSWSKEPPCLPEDNATIFFTSGTTGLPKGVLSSHRAALTNVFNILSSRFRAELRVGNDIPKPGPNETQKAFLIGIPLFHVTGCTAFVLTATAVGGKIVLMHKWEPREALRLIKDEGISTAGGVPAVILDLLDSYTGNGLPDLDTFSYGGAPAPAHMATEAKKVFPHVFMSQAYGMTETNSVAVAIVGEDCIQKSSSAGRAMPINDLLIVNPDTLKSVPVGQSGEIWMRGPNVMKGYWRDPAATAKVLTQDGWLRSGDVGYMDEDGFLYVRDRIKDMIIRGGENIDSISVENAVFNDSRVLECAAIGIPDKRLGELVAVIVVPKTDWKGKLKEEEVLAIAKPHLPAFAIPSLIIIQDEPMERNPAGKILKGPLRIQATKEWERRRHKKSSEGKSKAKL